MLQLQPLSLTARAMLIAAARMRPASVIDSTAPGKYSLNAATHASLIGKDGPQQQTTGKMQPIGESF